MINPSCLPLPKRILDIIVASGGLFLLSPVFLVIAILVKATSKGPCLYWSERIGANGKIFKMPKFRSMFNKTPAIPSALIQNPKQYLTSVGSFLRKNSFDELPQLWSILKGEMSLVGPRPMILSDHELITMRQKHGIDQCVPGLTGWAQVNGRDYLSATQKIVYEVEYLKRQSFLFDLYIVWLTFLKVCMKEGISH